MQRGCFGSRQGPPAQHTYLWGNMIKKFPQYKECHIMTASSPDFSETKPPNLPGRQVISGPSSISSWASPRIASLSWFLCCCFAFFAVSQPGNKAIRAALWVGGLFPFLFCCSVAWFWAREKEKLVSYSTSWLDPRRWSDEFATGRSSWVVPCLPLRSLGSEMEFGSAQVWKIRDKSAN